MVLQIYMVVLPLHVPVKSIDPDNKIHGANMGPTLVLSAPGGSHASPKNLAIRVVIPHLFLTIAADGQVPDNIRPSSFAFLLEYKLSVLEFRHSLFSFS